MAIKKTIGQAPCPICRSGPHPVKVSDTNNLYMVCPPPADGGCQSQIFARSAASNRALAQSITKWQIPKEERAEWLGDDPPPTADEAEEELQQAIEDDELQVVEPTPAPPPPRRSASPPSRTSAPVTVPTRTRRPPAAKPKAPAAAGRGLLYWGDDEE